MSVGPRAWWFPQDLFRLDGDNDAIADHDTRVGTLLNKMSASAALSPSQPGGGRSTSFEVIATGRWLAWLRRHSAQVHDRS